MKQNRKIPVRRNEKICRNIRILNNEPKTKQNKQSFFLNLGILHTVRTLKIKLN